MSQGVFHTIILNRGNWFQLNLLAMLSRSTQNKPIIRHASIHLACFGAMSVLALVSLHVFGHSRGITFFLCARSCPNALIKLPNDQDRKAEVAYTRQRQSADRVVQLMRAKPDDWERSSYHRPTKALWIDPFRDFYHHQALPCLKRSAACLMAANGCAA